MARPASRPEDDPERGIKEASGDGDSSNDAEERPEEILLDLVQGRPSHSDAPDDIPQVVFYWNHVAGSLGHIGPAAEGDAFVGSGQNGRIVGAVHHHPDHAFDNSSMAKFTRARTIAAVSASIVSIRAAQLTYDRAVMVKTVFCTKRTSVITSETAIPQFSLRREAPVVSSASRFHVPNRCRVQARTSRDDW